MTEESLVRAARAGDRSAYGSLLDRYARAVTARHYAVTREMSAAEDLTQETFMRGWQGLARLEDGRSFGSWILSIATHVGQEWLRKKITADRHRPGLARAAARRAELPDAGIDLPLAEALAELPTEYQDLLALRHGQGMSCEEIARETGRPLGSVTKTLSRAYARLRERLAGVRSVEGSPS